MSSFSKLYKQARPVPSALYDVNKYTYFSQFNIAETKYLDINDVLGDTDTELKYFIAEHGQILLFPNIVGGKITDIIVRSLNNKGHLKLGKSVFPYGIGGLNKDFKYGDTIYLVEGIGDYIALKLINPELNVVAMLSSTMAKYHIEFLKDITNNYVLFRDNDEAGKTGARKLSYGFKEYNLNLRIEESFGFYGLKDIGDLLDLIIDYNKTGDETVLSKINNMRQYYNIKTK